MEGTDEDVNLNPSKLLLLSKIFGKLDAMEKRFDNRIDSISNSISTIKSDLNMFKNATETRIKNVEKVEEVIESHTFINTEFEKNKTDMKEIMQKHVIRIKEIKKLKWRQ